MKQLLLFSLLLILLTSMDSDKDAYKIYKADGKESSFKKLLKEAADADIVLFGELHDNPVNHWLQLELSKELFNMQSGKIIMGAEMFETDNALIIKEYLAGNVADRNFESEARLWPNYKTDYKPLLKFAKDSSVNFIATNIPRRYAALVNKKGFEGLEALSPEAKQLIAPLPVQYDSTLSGYKAMLEMMQGSGHAINNLPKAQAIKDATMAHFILKNMKPEHTFLHFHGTYHSDNYQGIMWYLKQSDEKLKIVTISSVEQDTISTLKKDNFNMADFIIVTPSTMTKTH